MLLRPPVPLPPSAHATRLRAGGPLAGATGCQWQPEAAARSSAEGSVGGTLALSTGKMPAPVSPSDMTLRV